jgi:rhodanese-related sulfurtransferase
MSDVETIRAIARERGLALKLPYAGALTPAEAHALLQAGAKLVDVRTQAELYWVGRAPGSVYVEWNGYPGGTLNPDFLAQLAGVAIKAEPVMFLCRSGGRSHFAAILATQAGYAECYNVLEGFEGDKDARGQRNTVNGWRKAGLPWAQS